MRTAESPWFAEESVFISTALEKRYTIKMVIGRFVEITIDRKWSSRYIKEDSSKVVMFWSFLRIRHIDRQQVDQEYLEDTGGE